MSSWSDATHNLLTTIADWLPQFFGALIIALIGYVVAKAIEKVVAAALGKANFNSLLHRGTAGSYVERIITNPAKLVGSIVFWLIWLGTLTVAVTVLGVPALTAFVFAIYSYLPNVLAAILIFIVASAVASSAAVLATKLMGETPTGKLVSTVVPALTMLIATFMILNQLMIAPAIVTITYAALIGSVALGMALAFGLGGREVAARLLEQAYDAGRNYSTQAKQDLARGKARAESKVKEHAPDRTEPTETGNPLEG